MATVRNHLFTQWDVHIHDNQIVLPSSPSVRDMIHLAHFIRATFRFTDAVELVNAVPSGKLAAVFERVLQNLHTKACPGLAPPSLA
eukprot:gene987-2604_t